LGGTQWRILNYSNHPAAANSALTRRQSGVALITVLLITAILVGLTTQILSSHHLVIAQHQNSFEQEQALQYAIGAEELARQALVR
jgi:type II secretory pathway component PulK